MAYIEKPQNVPGKAIQVLAGDKNLKSDKVSVDDTCTSLDSYLCKDDIDLYRRRVSAGHVECPKIHSDVVKKRCSASTIRKLNKKGLDTIKKSKSEVTRLCEKVKNVKLRDKEAPKCYKTRSCNDIVRLVLTKHGIHVISDTEAIV